MAADPCRRGVPNPRLRRRRRRPQRANPRRDRATALPSRCRETETETETETVHLSVNVNVTGPLSAIASVNGTRSLNVPDARPPWSGNVIGHAPSHPEALRRPKAMTIGTSQRSCGGRDANRSAARRSTQRTG
jgi:hypothetical protein